MHRLANPGVLRTPDPRIHAVSALGLGSEWPREESDLRVHVLGHACGLAPREMPRPANPKAHRSRPREAFTDTRTCQEVHRPRGISPCLFDGQTTSCERRADDRQRGEVADVDDVSDEDPGPDHGKDVPIVFVQASRWVPAPLRSHDGGKGHEGL